MRYIDDMGTPRRSFQAICTLASLALVAAACGQQPVRQASDVAESPSARFSAPVLGTVYGIERGRLNCGPDPLAGKPHGVLGPVHNDLAIERSADGTVNIKGGGEPAPEDAISGYFLAGDQGSRPADNPDRGAFRRIFDGEVQGRRVVEFSHENKKTGGIGGLVGVVQFGNGWAVEAFVDCGAGR